MTRSWLLASVTHGPPIITDRSSQASITPPIVDGRVLRGFPILLDVRKPARPRRKPADQAVRAVGRRLRQLREAAGLTQEELGRAASLTAKYISQLENGHSDPSVSVVTRLAEEGLGLPIAAFFADASPTELRDDLAAVQSLIAGQPQIVRRRALRVIRSLIDE